MIKSGDPDHAFPRGVDALEKAGNRFFQRGKNGAMYEHLQINGSYKGREGTFEGGFYKLALADFWTIFEVKL